MTSGTLFHSRKLLIREYLAVIALFAGGVKGVAALRMASDMNINPKSAFVLLHKLREAIVTKLTAVSWPAPSRSTAPISEGSAPSEPKSRPPRSPLLEIQRQVVVVARERGIGQTRTWVVGKESMPSR